MSWWTVQAALTAALLVLPDVDQLTVTGLGIDEHRYRSVRYYRDQAGGWRRFEPGCTSRLRGRRPTIVDARTGQVLDAVDGRDSAGIGAWLAKRSSQSREGIEVVAIDPSAAFRKALRLHLPTAAVSADAPHLVKLAGETLTAVRQRRPVSTRAVTRAPGRSGLGQPAPAPVRRGHLDRARVGALGDEACQQLNRRARRARMFRRPGCPISRDALA